MSIDIKEIYLIIGEREIIIYKLNRELELANQKIAKLEEELKKWQLITPNQS